MEIVPYDIKDFENYKDSKDNIESFEIEVLSQFKETDQYEDSIELLLEILNKNPKYIKNVYKVLSETFCYDEDSYDNKYSKEYFVIDKIWQLSEYGKKEKETFLLLSIFKHYLDIENQITESSSKERSIIVKYIKVLPTEKAYELRKNIWKILYKLYQINLYKPYVEKFLFNYNIYGSNDNYRKDFIKFDLDCFLRLFVSRKKIISFNMAAILYNLTKIYDYVEEKPNKELLRYKDNKEFMLLYYLLEKELYNQDWHTSEEKRKQKIKKQILSYKKNEAKWVKFFNAYKKYEKAFFASKYLLYQGLTEVLEIIEKSPRLYLFVMNLYFKKHIQTNYPPYKIVDNLFNFIGIKQTKKLINQSSEKEKDHWLKAFYENYPENFINKNVCKNLIKFTEKTLKSENPQIISAFSLKKYKNVDSQIIKTISQKICNENNNKNIIGSFLKPYFSKESVEKLIDIYKDDIEILEELYFLYIKQYEDTFGLFFIELFNKDVDFWNKFTQKFAESEFGDHYNSSSFKYIWEKDNYTKYIDIAINNIMLKTHYIYSEFLVEKIFPKPEDKTSPILDNQQTYISDFILRNKDNKEKLYFIFQVIVYQFENLKNKYIQELLKINNDINIFKKIPIEKSSYSWNGSFVPIIEQRIKSLESIKSMLQGSKYIEHRCYLDKLINYKKDRLQKEKLNDFLQSI